MLLTTLAKISDQPRVRCDQQSMSEADKLARQRGGRRRCAGDTQLQLIDIIIFNELFCPTPASIQRTELNKCNEYNYVLTMNNAKIPKYLL